MVIIILCIYDGIVRIILKDKTLFKIVLNRIKKEVLCINE